MPALISLKDTTHFVPFQVAFAPTSCFIPFLVHSTVAVYLFVVGNVVLAFPSITAAMIGPLLSSSKSFLSLLPYINIPEIIIVHTIIKLIIFFIFIPSL